MGQTVLRIARTVLLCGTLGLALYLVLAGLAETPAGTKLLPRFLGLVGAAFLLVLTVQEAISAWKTGLFPSRGRAVLREREPNWFRVLLIWQILLIVMLAALLSYLLALPVER